MGIIKLMDFIKATCPTIIRNRSPLHYKNKVLAIDSPSAIYKFLIKTISTPILIHSILPIKSKHPNRCTRQSNRSSDRDNVSCIVVYGSWDKADLGF